MKKLNKFSPEPRERVVRMALEYRDEYSSMRATTEKLCREFPKKPSLNIRQAGGGYAASVPPEFL
ncbi:MAG: hypothetical protein J0I60_06365 [Nitrosospira sp.]|jgi:hypothetical protein|nr:hypothetical protein [Nitrosospira sp.]